MSLPVPPGFTVTTDAGREYLRAGAIPAGLFAEVEHHLRAVQTRIGKSLGDAAASPAAPPAPRPRRRYGLRLK